MSAQDSPRNRAVTAPLPSRKSLPPFEALRAFDAVARLGGVRKAAQYLCRDHAVISRHLRAIEEWTGARLVERTSGGVALTEEGQRYHAEIAAAMNIISGATTQLMKRGDSHALHILCMPGFALHWLACRLGDFEKANADVDVQLRPANRSPELLAQDADVEIRLAPTYGPPLDVPASLRCIEVARAPIVAVASRAYLANAAPIAQPRDLLSHQLLHEENFDRWRNWLSAHGVCEEVEITGPRLWQGHLTLDAARHGRGIALTNSLIVADDLAAGRLVEVGEDCSSFLPHTDGIYYLIAHADRWDTPLMRKFRYWLMSSLAQEHPQFRAAPAA
jgi:DNA-binding transcriptional LysR family regulator